MGLSLKNIIKAYEILKKRAQTEFAKGEHDKAYATVKQAASLPIQFNWCYADEELEDLMAAIAKVYLPVVPESIVVHEDRYILIDDFCRSFILAIQYLDAFKSMGKNVLYIVTTSDMAYGSSKSILERVKQYPNVKVVVLDDKQNEKDKSQCLLTAILDYAPAKLFLHVHEESPSLPVLYRLPNSIKKYMINLSDQRFWLGAKAIDYSIEFRPFGATVSLEKRGLRKEQLLYVPFYPVTDGNAFKGFPEISKDKVVLFSGGDFYKTVSPKQEYWHFIKELLDNNSNAVLLYAIKSRTKSNDEFLERFIKNNHFQSRIFNLGFRDDINEVFAHCDIYIGTCPTSGSLMSQLAAWNKKPILQLYLPNTTDDETEQAICYHEQFSISSTNVENLLNEARFLINDESYRKIQGERLFSAMIKPNEFVKLLTNTLENRVQTVLFKKVNYQEITGRWVWLEKEGFINTRPFLVSLLSERICRRKMPIMWIGYKMKQVINCFPPPPPPSPHTIERVKIQNTRCKRLFTRLYRKISKDYAYWEKQEVFYYTWTGKKLNLKNPRSISEKLMWLSRYWQHPLKTLCADKYRVRKYISDCGYGNMLIPIIGVWKNGNDIDFNLLPNKFVLKCNHGCGFNVICQDKNKIDFAQSISRINNWLKIKFGIDTFEVHYSDIEPLVMCEEFLQSTSDSLVDYKLHCINGVPHSFLICTNRNKTNHNDVQLSSYSLEWKKLNWIVNENNDLIDAPMHLKTMIEVAKVLSMPFPYVRIDYYEVNEKLYIGEMTFTPQCNIMDYYKEEILQEMGDKLVLPKPYKK